MPTTLPVERQSGRSPCFTASLQRGKGGVVPSHSVDQTRLVDVTTRAVKRPLPSAGSPTRCLVSLGLLALSLAACGSEAPRAGAGGAGSTVSGGSGGSPLGGSGGSPGASAGAQSGAGSSSLGAAGASGAG